MASAIQVGDKVYHPNCVAEELMAQEVDVKDEPCGECGGIITEEVVEVSDPEDE